MTQSQGEDRGISEGQSEDQGENNSGGEGNKDKDNG